MPDTLMTVRLPVNILARMRDIARAHDRSLSAELRVALNDYINRENAA